MAAYGAARFGAPSEAITASEQRLSDLQDRRAKLEVVAQKLEPFQQQVIELGRKLVTLRAIVPVSDDPEALVAQVQSIAARSGVTLVAVSSQPAVAKGGLYREVPLQVEAVAGPPALVTFVDRFFRLPRLVVMPELAIEAPSGGRRRLLLRTRIVGFAMPDGAR
jgi:Tfp pilus assembly protein PilO